MKKQLLFTARYYKVVLLMAVVTSFTMHISAQEISFYQFRSVPPDKTEEFIKRETKYWSNVAQKAIDKGLLTFWGLFEKVGGQDLQNTPNFLFINGYKNIDSAEYAWNPTAVFPKVPIAQMETGSLSKTTDNFFLSSRGWQEATGVKEENDFRYVAMFFHSSSDPDSFAKAEIKIWGPFIKTTMDQNHTKQRGWGNAVVLAPRGPDVKFNSVSYDLFPTLNAALMEWWDPSVKFPMDGFTELDKLRTKPPGRVIYRVVKVVNTPTKK